MLKPTDLRIGNLLNYNLENNLVPILIDWNHLQWLHEYPERFRLDCTPIIITKEWVLKMGFKNEATKNAEFFLIPLKEVGTEILKGLCLYYENSDNEWQICFTDYYTGKEKTEMFPYGIKYVHQLQNLYFGLTGNDLIINK